MTYDTAEEYEALTVPDRLAGSYDPARAQQLFYINCLVCHGPTLRGFQEPDESRKAPIIRFMERGPFPADLTGEVTENSTDGELFAFISRGGRQGFVALMRDRNSSSPMPQFQYLLTEEERWTLVQFIRSYQ